MRACGKCVSVCRAGALRLAGKLRTADAVMREVLRDRIFYEDSGGGLTVSGGELVYGEDTVVWQVFEEGEYTLTARRGLRTRTVTYTVNVTEDGLSVLKAR